jgi:predicted amidohydrolase
VGFNEVQNGALVKLRIGLIQQRCEKAAVPHNLEDVSRVLRDAAARKIDLLGFPEMNITGYADPTCYPQAVIRLDGAEMADFLRRTEAFAGTVLAGLIEENPGSKPFITHVAARQGKQLGVYRKMTIKDDEERWFSPGANVPVFQHDGLVFGISICADIGNPQVFAACSRQGAKIIFELAAPGLYGEQSARNWQSGYAWWEGECRRLLGGYACEHAIWIAAATQAGRTVDEDFPGGGYLFNPQGERVFSTKDWSVGEVFLEIDLDGGAVKEI